MLTQYKTIVKKPLHGWLEMISGPMFSGKSEELIKRLRKVGYAKKKVQLFKPASDNRYSTTEVRTHAGDKMTSISIRTPKAIFDFLEWDTQVVGIDEIQFFQTKNASNTKYEIEEVIEELLQRGVVVIGAGLDKYSTGEHFGPMPFLVNSAKFSDKYHAVCVGLDEEGCGEKSFISFKTGIDRSANEGNSITLGSFGEYVPLCENCWTKAKVMEEI